MSDTGSILRADIARHPGDITLRLVYADWLEDHGDPLLAAAIRSRSEDLVTIPYNGQAVWRPPGCKQLIYLDGPPAYLARIGDFWKWRAGFIEGIRCRTEVWLNHGPQLIREHPLTDVQLHETMPGRLPGGARIWSSDRGSARTDIYSTGRWGLTNYLPPELFVHLDGFLSLSDSPREAIYDAYNKAMEAQSRACLKWARGIAFPT